MSGSLEAQLTGRKGNKRLPPTTVLELTLCNLGLRTEPFTALSGSRFRLPRLRSAAYHGQGTYMGPKIGSLHFLF